MYNRLALSIKQRELLDTVLTELEISAAFLHTRDADIFRLRLERYWAELYEPLERLYGDTNDSCSLIKKVVSGLLKAAIARSSDLHQLDLEREMTPDWFQQSHQVGGIFYVDLFAETLQGVAQHIDYLQELGFTYIHLMPLLQPRPGENDGGYAVMDYRKVDPSLGTIEDLQTLIESLRIAGISVCLDVVVNHTAKEHVWAQAAVSGDSEHQNYYLMYPDRTLPDAYEQTLPEVFPDFAPGNFTWYPELQRWVWTTFNEFQWDLNYTNPHVWMEMLDILLYLANLGVEILRLDAVPFMWKRLGTDSQNQPEVLDILQAWRAAMRIVCPATLFKAEAIVAPNQLVQYLGLGQYSHKLCELAYHNSLMVLLWSSLATHKADLISHSLQSMPHKPNDTSWITYVRCHDDIGWAITDTNAEAIGHSGSGHREFLSDWYAGLFPGTWSRGIVFQHNLATGDRRISGMTASLAGLEAAIEANDAIQIELAIRRILLLYAIICAFNGIPLIYMGDEIGLLNDASYLADPRKAIDNRWLHRPRMRWDIAAQRHDPTTVAGRIWQGLQRIIYTRKSLPALHARGSITIVHIENIHLFGFIRTHPLGTVVVIANMSDTPQVLDNSALRQHTLGKEMHDVLNPLDQNQQFQAQHILLEPYQVMWLQSNQ